MPSINQAASIARSKGYSEAQIADLTAQVRTAMKKYGLTESEAIDVVGKKRFMVHPHIIECQII
jgi:hypothetical protein